MKSNYIPEILKEKLSSFYKFIYFLILFLVSIILALSLLTFDINDNSFLTSTSNPSKNLLGDFGSYLASFIFYTFGVLGYLIIFFFLLYSIFVFFNKNPRYIFIRLLFFFISLILIPQSIIQNNFNIKFFNLIETWGFFANIIYNLHDINYVHHFLSLIGLIIFLFSQNIIYLFKVPKINVLSIFKTNTKKESFVFH